MGRQRVFRANSGTVRTGILHSFFFEGAILVGYCQNPVKIRLTSDKFHFFSTTLVSNRSTSGQNQFKNCLFSKKLPHLTLPYPKQPENLRKQPNNNRTPLKTLKKEKEREREPPGPPPRGGPLGGGGPKGPPLSLFFSFLDVFLDCLDVFLDFLDIFWLFWVR